MHSMVKPASSVLSRRVALFAETDVSHVAILQSAVSFSATRIAMNKVFENKLDVIRDRAVILDTVGVTLCAVSFKLILIAEFFVRRCNSSVVGSPVFAGRCW